MRPYVVEGDVLYLGGCCGTFNGVLPFDSFDLRLVQTIHDGISRFAIWITRHMTT